MTSGLIVADRKCEAFMFNRLTGVCTLLSGEGSMRLISSSKFWSGKLICDDIGSVDDWAEGVVSRRSPPPLAPTSATAPTILSTTSSSDPFEVLLTWTPGDDSFLAGDPAFFATCVTSGTPCPVSPAFDENRPSGTTTTTVTGLLIDTSYDCYVVAKNSQGNGVCSNMKTFTTCFPGDSVVITPTGKKLISHLEISFTSQVDKAPTYGPAAAVRVGDYVNVVSEDNTIVSLSKVTAVEEIFAQGYFNPYTMEGNIIVDGIVASCHSSFILDKLFNRMGISIPAGYQAVFAPLRVIFKAVGAKAFQHIQFLIDAIIDIVNHPHLTWSQIIRNEFYCGKVSKCD
eukprot:jgi/Picre1/33896/NNA_001375.t1